MEKTLKKYQIIYIDPPWKYGGHGGTKWWPAKCFYKTMTFEEIKKWGNDNIIPIADDNCLMFCWVVSPELPKCIETITSWGFKYITFGFVWYKQRANVGNYTMSGCELCLIFKKGKIPFDRVRNPGQQQFYAEKVNGHSTKPDEIRNRIAKMFPLSNKIEIFARKRVDEWDAIGDELNINKKD